MSENIPSTSSGITKHSSCSPKTLPRKNRRKSEKLKLPTPPPDPKENKTKNCTENEFLEYLEHLQKHKANYSRSTSTLASALVTEDAFDHLEKLYKLMEQMLELRSQNAKLHRKIRDLEHLNNLQKMYKKLEQSAVEDMCPELEKDTAFAETILESILYEPKLTPKNKASFRQSLMRKHRNRSSSAIDKPVGLDAVDTSCPRRASLCASPTKKSSKVSKWTKVKAAFKWEKASTTVGDAKSLDSGISGITPMEIARYLRVPSSEDAGHSHSDSGAAEISTPGSLSSASSNENFHKTGHRCLYDDFRSSDDEHHNSTPHSKEDPSISPRSSQRSHRTPWARMKDMINTKNPVRKKSRMSTNSDDIQIDIELCSDNEEVFEDNSKPLLPSTPDSTSATKFYFDDEIPDDVLERYKNNEDRSKDSEYSESISKWTKVKKAFLPNLDLTNTSSHHKNHDGMSDSDIIQSEINKSYRNLQKKLSLEFQEKLNEWKKIKQIPNTGSSPTPSCSNTDEMPTSTVFLKKMEEWEKIKSQPTSSKTNIPMTNQENLPPEFKKKLKEWEIIKKSPIGKNTKKPAELPRWKSLQTGKTSQNPHIEVPIISEEFKKKLEDWKHIKASHFKNNEGESKNTGNKTPSPKLFRANSKPRQEEKEIHWYEKELNKIEKEKCRLEKERLKFIEREERLSKLRKSVTGDHKRDILVHTPSGFYKFEGISRKFTQKLYEWEKSRGIRPESSTFAFLSADRPQFSIPKVKINGKDHTPPLTRSRSVDSVAVSTINAECPLTSQPSSLSLNDVDELEKKCLLESKVSSLEYLACSETDAEEPEAIIVEVEDFVEETAAPLKSYIEQHNAVYQCEEMRALCEGETCLAPKIRRSESARAQTNYNLIEDALTSLRLLWENEIDIRTIEKNDSDYSMRRKDLLGKHQFLLSQLVLKVQKLQEENSVVVTNLSKEKMNESSCHLIEILEVVQDLSFGIASMVEKLNIMIKKRVDDHQEIQVDHDDLFHEITTETNCKLLELRRHLSYVCAVSDSTTPIKRRMKSVICEKVSNDSQGTTSDVFYESTKNENRPGLYEKSQYKNSSNLGAVKKRLRYRAENIRRKSIEHSDEENDFEKTDQKKYPKFLRSRTLSDDSSKIEEKNPHIFPVVSKTTFQDSPSKILASDSPVTIFVKTTRKLFTPFIEISLKEKDDIEELSKPDITNLSMETNDDGHVEEEETHLITEDDNSEQFGVVGLPPLPSSPIPQKKYMKDMSPSIRIMLAKYNQKLSEQDLITRSGGSSGSASPVAWRSPTAERRVKAQTEKYQEEISKAFPFKREVQKSASQGVIHSTSKHLFPRNNDDKSESKSNENNRNIMKSSSATTLMRRKEDNEIIPFCTETMIKEDSLVESKYEKESNYKISSELRLQKLRKAKEDFLNSGPCPITPSDTKSETNIQYPRRNRLSQISVENNSSVSSISPGFLVKSVSAGMINISEEAFKTFEDTQRPYVSLPRTTKLVEKKSALNQISSKFRKIKMKKGKEREKEKFSTVSELCRQSLIVDINDNNNTNSNACNSACTSNRPSLTEESLLPISKSTSWIQRAKFFRK